MVLLACLSLHHRLLTSASGNLHLNIVADAFLPEIQDALEPFIYEVVRKLAFPNSSRPA